MTTGLSDAHFAYFLALMATLCFSSASLVFSEYTKRFGTLWMNSLKAFVAFFFCLVTFRFYGPFEIPTLMTWLPLGISGFLGLCIGDLFLLQAFTHLGVARTMMLFGFQPLVIGIASHFLFNQDFESRKLIAIIFLIACLLTFAWEGFQKERTWKVKGLLFALVGVLLDACGVMLSRYGYDQTPNFPALHGHLVRSFFAVGGFLIIGIFIPLRLKSQFVIISLKQKTLLLSACFLGTFFSLFLYLNALQIGHLASLSGIAVTGPVFAAFLECAMRKKLPSKYLLISFAFFLIGFYILML